jgi:hypothetical protein
MNMSLLLTIDQVSLKIYASYLQTHSHCSLMGLIGQPKNNTSFHTLRS